MKMAESSIVTATFYPSSGKKKVIASWLLNDDCSRKELLIHHQSAKLHTLRVQFNLHAHAHH